MRSTLRTPVGAALVVAAIAAGTVAASGSASRSDTTPPGYLTRPVVTGLAVGQPLTVSTGTWAGSTPMTFYYQWIRSDSGDGTPIDGATSATYTPTDADAGHQLMVQVKAQNAAGPAWANSTWTPQVVGPAGSGASVLADGRTSVLAENVALPNRLVIVSADFTPEVLRASGRVSARVTVVDTLKHPVRGALVQVTGLPFGSLASVAETPTDANGVATITLAGRPQLLARVPGDAIALSLRARKAGDDVLAGVTAQRLVELRFSR